VGIRNKVHSQNPDSANILQCRPSSSRGQQMPSSQTRVHILGLRLGVGLDLDSVARTGTQYYMTQRLIVMISIQFYLQKCKFCGVETLNCLTCQCHLTDYKPCTDCLLLLFIMNAEFLIHLDCTQTFIEGLWSALRLEL